MKTIVKMLLVILIMGGTFFGVKPAYAGDDGSDEPSEEEYLGFVSTSEGIDGVTQQLPGGGSAYAQAQIGWAVLRVDGIAKTSLSSGVTGTFSICAKADEVFKDGTSMGGVGQICASKTGGGSVKSTKKVFTAPFGHLWQVDTEHSVTAAGFNWYPTNTLSTFIPWP